MSVSVYLEDLKAVYLKGFSEIQVRKVVGDIASLDLCPFEGQVLILQRAGKVETGVTLKGWMNLAQRRGISSVDTEYAECADGDISCTGFVTVDGGTFKRTEFLSECRRPTPIWKQMPKRMLGHRAVIQALRMACGGAAPVAEELADDGFRQAGGLAPAPELDSPTPVADIAKALQAFQQAEEETAKE